MANNAIADPRAPGGFGASKNSSNGLNAAFRPPGILAAPDTPDKPSYVFNFSIAATANIDIFTLGAAGPDKIIRLRRIVLVNPGSATAAAIVDASLNFASSVGSGGAAATVQSVDQSLRLGGQFGGPDAAYPGTARTGDTTQAGGIVTLYSPLASISVPAAAGAFAAIDLYNARDWFKPVTVGGGGGPSLINFRIPSVGAGATALRGFVEFTMETA